MNNKLQLKQFKKIFLVQSIFAIFIAAPNVASANDIKDTNYLVPSGAYFVSPDGKATNSGQNPASPWPVVKALDSAPSGATIVFRGGTYRNISNSIRKKLTLQPYPHEKAWIKGSIEVTGWIIDGNKWRKDGWNFSFPCNVSSSYIDSNYPMARYCDMTYINGVSLKQVASVAEVVSGTFYVDSVNKQLYIGDNPAGKTVEATVLSKAFGVGVTTTSNPSDTIIRGLGFAHYANQGVAVGAARVTLENNTFVWNGEQGVRFWGESNGTSAPSIDAIVRGNIFSYNGRNGLWGDRVHRMLLENNRITYNNIERFSTSTDAAGVKIIRSDRLTGRNNFVERNLASGIWVDVSSSNTTIVHNTSQYNQSAGIYLEISHKGIIAANIAYKNGTGIHVSNTSSAKVYNNTLVSNGTNLRVKDTDRNNSNANEIAAGITWIARNNVIKNNIFSNATNLEGALFDASNCGTNEPSALMFDMVDYDAYYRTSSSTPPNLIKWSLGPNKCRIGYTTLAGFRAATGFEQNGTENVTPNPFFVDEANRDFRLKTGSPAIGAGDQLPSDVASAIGLPTGVKVDLGALQTTVY